MADDLRFLAALEDIVLYGSKAIDIARNLSADRYADDWNARLAVERCLTVVGESAVRIRKLGYEESLTHIHSVIGFRNLLVHAYENVSPASVWEILTLHLPGLVSQAQNILDKSSEKGDVALDL